MNKSIYILKAEEFPTKTAEEIDNIKMEVRKKANRLGGNSMTLFEQICLNLNIKYGEIFVGDVGYKLTARKGMEKDIREFRVTKEDGLVFFNNFYGTWDKASVEAYQRLINGKLINTPSLVEFLGEAIGIGEDRKWQEGSEVFWFSEDGGIVEYVADRWGSNWVPRHEKLITILSKPYNPTKIDLPTLNYIETKKDEVVAYINSIYESFVEGNISHEKLKFCLAEAIDDLEFLQDIILNNYKEILK